MAEEKKTPASTRAKKTTTSTRATKSAPRRKTTAKATEKEIVNVGSIEAKIESNARHIEEDHKVIENNSKMIHLLYGAIILLMMIIAGLAFYIGSYVGGGNNTPSVTGTTQQSGDITITVIDDTRCNDCQTDGIVTQLQALPFLSAATFIRQDFSDAGVSDYIEENNITALPAVIFDTNTLFDGGQITPYLTALPDGQYSLALGSTFNPFAKRSEKGFLMVEEDILNQIKETAYYQGDTDARVTWVEFSDVNCFYCKKMAKDETYESVKEAIPTGFNHTLYNFIGVGGAATQSAAEVLECIGTIAGAEVYSTVFHKSLVEEKNTTDELLGYANEAGADTASIQSCIDSGESKAIVETKFALGRDTFGITGTPGNIIINNETGEYELISGAYPAETFIEVINRMLAE